MNEGILQIILAFFGLIGTILTGVAIPYYRSKTTTEQREANIIQLDNILTTIQIAVDGAEQLEKAGLIKYPKKAYVKDYIVKWSNEKGIDLNKEDLDIMIEAAVRELTIKQDQIK